MVLLIKSAKALIESRRFSQLLTGYDEDIRNAIAHGQIVFTGLGIQYGEVKRGISTFDFLDKFDSLWRTCNALAIALVVFLARQHVHTPVLETPKLPLALITLLASAAVETAGVEVQGTAESELSHIGRQLHIAIRLPFLQRQWVMFECARLSMHLIQNGAVGYSRFVFSIDQGKTVSSLLLLDAEGLTKLLRQNGPATLLKQVFVEPMLLWHDESRLSFRLEMYKSILRNFFQNQRDLLQAEWRRIGIRQGEGLYSIKHVKNKSVAEVPRVEAIVTLRYPADAANQETIKHIVRSVVNKLSRKRFKPPPSIFETRWRLPSRPKYIWIKLHRLDGTLRWLEGGGLANGNLLVIAEKIKGSQRQPILVKQPDEIWNGIRFRYFANQQQRT